MSAGIRQMVTKKGALPGVGENAFLQSHLPSRAGRGFPPCARRLVALLCCHKHRHQGRQWAAKGRARGRGLPPAPTKTRRQSLPRSCTARAPSRPQQGEALRHRLPALPVSAFPAGGQVSRSTCPCSCRPLPPPVLPSRRGSVPGSTRAGPGRASHEPPPEPALRAWGRAVAGLRYALHGCWPSSRPHHSFPCQPLEGAAE